MGEPAWVQEHQHRAARPFSPTVFHFVLSSLEGIFSLLQTLQGGQGKHWT